MLPEPGGTLAKEAVVRAIEASPRWADIRMENLRVMRPAEVVAVLTYKARASRPSDDPAYSALISSVYVLRDGSWKLVFHQQTPVS